MALFFTESWKDLVSLWDYSLLAMYKAFRLILEISIQLFYSYFYFQVINVFVTVLMLPLLILPTVFNLSFVIFIYFLSPCIDAWIPSLMQANPLLSSFLDKYSLSMPSFILSLFPNFLVIWSISVSSIFIYFMNGPLYLISETG